MARLQDHVLQTTDADAALDAFLAWVASVGIELYDAQEEAILELFGGAHVVLDTPTGSGKSLVALALHFRELCMGGRSVYTAPIKALVSEKYRALVDAFGEDAVGIMTGDGAVNPDAQVLTCTAEVLGLLAIREGSELAVDAVVMDEFHYYGDRDRGMAWQIPLLTLPQARFLLMSGTLGDTQKIREDLELRTGIEPVVVQRNDRPVPLSFQYRETTVESTLRDFVGQGKAPVYAVHFTQRAATERALGLLSSDFATPEKKRAIQAAVKGFSFDSPFGKTVRRLVLHGVGLHHAGLLPKYRMLMERLAQDGHFVVICGTDTLGVGINVPIRSVLFTQLCKFDGSGVDIIGARHFQQIAGRAGRKGYDDEGFVAAQEPEWVLENRKLEALIESGAKKRSKVVKKKPPTRGYKHWDSTTFERLISARPEALESRFDVDHGLVLAYLQRADEQLLDGMAELHGLIDDCHSSQRAKARLHVQADARLEQLIAAGVIEDEGEDAVPRYRVQPDLQHDFSLHHSLSLFALHALELLDPESQDYALDVVTVVESILENPGPVLAAQVQREKTAVLADLKAKGVPYEERLEVLDEVTYPKPRGPWVYETFNTYKETRPWLADCPIRPKTVVREMFEVQHAFGPYVKSLKMERSEGVLLRYLSGVYRALQQNVPEVMQTETLLQVMGYLRALLAQIDDSLVVPWEQGATEGAEVAERPLWTDERALKARIRAELFAFLKAVSVGDWEGALTCVCKDSEGPVTPKGMETLFEPYISERGTPVIDGRVRAGWTTRFERETPQKWRIEQVLVDDDEDYTYSLKCTVELGNEPVSGPIVRILALD